MTTKEIETLKETVISLLLENTTLKKKLQSSTESSMFWYEKHEDLKKEITSKNKPK